MKQASYNDIFANDSNILVVRPRLAEIIGLHEAIIVNQIEYWLNVFRTQKGAEDHHRNGRWWVYNTIKEWHDQFPFMSEDLIQRKLSALRKKGILIASSNMNKKAFDKTLWYTIDYDGLCEIVDEYEKEEDETGENPSETRKNVENSHIGKIPTSMVENSRHGCLKNPDTNTIDYTETTKQRIIKAIGSLSTDRTDFDVSLGKSLQNMRKVISDDKEYEAMKYLTEYFYSILYSRTREVHHVLSKPQCQKIYDALTDAYEPISYYRDEAVWQIHRYFNDFIKRDDVALTMEHFATAGILEIGDYELAYRPLIDEDVDYRMFYASQHPDCLMNKEAEDQLLASGAQ